MIKAPYNFVNLNHDIFIPQWEGQISHDVPFSDGEDGQIEVELTNTTPLLIRNGAGASASDDEVLPSHIVLPDGSKRYFLPGSSIKGMLRSVLEILSFGRLDKDFYNDDLMGYRDFGGRKSALQTPYMAAMAKVGYGWLRFDAHKGMYLLDDCGDFDKSTCTISIAELKGLQPRYVEKDDAFKKNDALNYPVIKGRKLVCSGFMRGKKHEYLFGEIQRPDVVVAEGVVDSMKNIYKPSRVYYDTSCLRLRAGKRIPVFFRRANDGSVLEMGLTRMFRHAYKHRISDCVKQEDKSGHDLAQCIFGYAEKDASLKGRVSVGNAFCKDSVSDDRLVSVCGVLGQPRASYFPFYLKQDVPNKYNTYDTETAEMAGRKRYRIHADHVLTKVPEGNGNKKVMTNMQMLPAGLHFNFVISLHNLRPMEVGALLSALTFHGTKGACHNIGMAKAYGYGKLKIGKITLRGLLHDMTAYLKYFELGMSDFTMSLPSHAMMWPTTPQVRQLLSIASEHADASQLTMMELEEYSQGKKNNAYTVLTEKEAGMQVLVSKDDMIRFRLFQKTETIEHTLSTLKPVETCSASECAKACGLLEAACGQYEELQKKHFANCFQDRVEELKQLRKVYNDAILKLSASNVSTSAASTLEEQIPKVTGINQLEGRLKKWVKAKDGSSLTGEECATLHARLQSFWEDKAFKKEKKQWMTAGEGAWKKLAQYVTSDEIIQKWYEELIEAHS